MIGYLFLGEWGPIDVVRPNPLISHNLLGGKTDTKIVRKRGIFVKRKYPARERASARHHQLTLNGTEASSARTPFQRICTPMQTSKNEASCMITLMAVGPSTRASLSENP